MVDSQFAALARTRNSSMGPPGRIDLTTHHTINRCSTTISRYQGHVVILIFQAVKFSADFSENNLLFVIISITYFKLRFKHVVYGHTIHNYPGQ